MVAQNVAFGIIAVIIIVSALRVVTTRNVVHAALYLVVVLAGVAASYFLLGSEFIGVTQVLVYIGAIIVLFLFGIMLTRAPLGVMADIDSEERWQGLVVAVALAGIMTYALIDGFEDAELPGEQVQTTAQVSDSIFSTYLVPFEIVSVLLLAALIGAIVLARKD
ncbi:MAG: NADH-quinone oxidoreductase subunit J [Actinomycetota bacterium]